MISGGIEVINWLNSLNICNVICQRPLSIRRQINFVHCHYFPWVVICLLHHFQKNNHFFQDSYAGNQRIRLICISQITTGWHIRRCRYMANLFLDVLWLISQFFFFFFQKSCFEYFKTFPENDCGSVLLWRYSVRRSSIFLQRSVTSILKFRENTKSVFLKTESLSIFIKFFS